MTQRVIERDDTERKGSRKDAVTIKLDYVAVANPTRRETQETSAGGQLRLHRA